MVKVDFLAISSLDSLHNAWLKVSKNNGAPGGDGVSIQEFDVGLAQRLVLLQKTARSGKYRPKKLRLCYIPKKTGPDGKPQNRKLLIPSVRDRILQTAVAQHLMPILDPQMEDSSFAYRPGRSVRMAAMAIRRLRTNGYCWVVDADITDYFDRVDQDRLLDTLDRYIDCPDLKQLIMVWLEQAGVHGRGLPQGSPLSPILANIYLDGFDEAMHRRGIRPVRFSDDFVLLCKSRAKAVQALDIARQYLDTLGLELNDSKTSITDFNKGFRFLGHLFVRSMVMQFLNDPEVSELDRILMGIPQEEDLKKAEEDNQKTRKIRHRPKFRILYLTRKNLRLTTTNHAFTVIEYHRETGEKKILNVPPNLCSRIEIHPEAPIDREAVLMALEHDIPLFYVNGRGDTLGQTTAENSRRHAVQLAQAKHALMPELRIALAKKFVEGRLKNQRALLRRLYRKRTIEGMERELAHMTRLIRNIKYAREIQELMGMEGNFARLYWPALGKMLLHDWVFDRRHRQPPPDPVNMVFSYLSAMLYRDMRHFVNRHGLHAGYGMLHATRDGHFGCVSDLVEEFRAPIAESLTINMFNNRILSSEMFDVHKNTCDISNEGRRRLITHYEKWVGRMVTSQQTGRKANWRHIMEEQVVAYIRHVKGTVEYQPYLIGY